MTGFEISLLDLAGVLVLALCASGGLYGLYLIFRTPHKLAGLLLGLVSAAVIGAFAFLTISTTARRAFINLEMGPLLSTVLRDLIAVALGVLIFYIINRIARRWQGKSSLVYGLAHIVGLVVVAIPVLFWLYSSTFSPDLDQVFTQVETVEGITFEPDVELTVQLFENEVVKAPAAMTMGIGEDSNALYVAGSVGTNGTIWRLVDTDNDGKADDVSVFYDGLTKPQGLVWGEEGLFANEEGRLLRLNDTDGDGRADQRTVILDGFPGEIYAFHLNHGLIWGPGDRLYIGSGSTTDQSEETNPMAARVLSINPDGSDMQVYVEGVRNPFGMVLSPDGEGIFAIENSSSGCANPDCTEKFDVPEEVNYLVQGGNYGFPNYFGLAPLDSGTISPVVTFPEHSAPTGIVFYTGERFPARMQGQLFVSLWARGEIYRIRLQQLDDQRYVGSPLLFASGLQGPSALLNAPNGGLFVTSYTGNAIYLIG
jgi:putative membrane-bound dehydrogenase-like protein